jgi:hypothetical protein
MITEYLTLCYHIIEWRSGGGFISFYKRRLTHRHPEGRSIFLTCRPHGSLSTPFLQRPRLPQQSAGQRFVEVDMVLDAAATGPVWRATQTSRLSGGGSQFGKGSLTINGYRTMRSPKKIRSYIENNPVRARPVPRSEEWLWCSADRGLEKSTVASGCTSTISAG